MPMRSTVSGLRSTQSSLVVIVGETASGKSALALAMAERWNGEIIASDSRTVYRGMDIGTAKPSKDEQAKVPHHLLDVVNLDEKFSAIMFQQSALELIEELSNRGKLPIIVGGTGLYIDSIIFDYEFHSFDAERDPLNPRHLKRTEPAADTKPMRPNTLVLGLSVSKDELDRRVTKRVEAMIADGLEAEVKQLSQKYGWGVEAMTGVGYREWQAYFEGEQSMEETKQLIITHTLQYAKRQRTWFKRNKSIQWFDNADGALQFISGKLTK